MAESDTPSGAARSRISWRQQAANFGPLIALVVVVLVYAIADQAQGGQGNFVSKRNLCTIAVQTTVVAVASLGMTVIVIAGGIDLSAGTALALSATVLARCLEAGHSPAAAITLGIATGLATGLVNGLLVNWLKVVPFIVTLGTMTAYLGFGKILAKETTVRPHFTHIPDWIPALVDSNPQPIVLFSNGVWMLSVLAIVMGLVLRRTVFGRHVFAIGSNETAARLSGIPVMRVKLAVYAVGGLFVGIGGLYQFARLTAADPGSGIGKELEIIAAVVIGGASLSGGRGSILGTLCGATLMGVISAGNTLLGVPRPYQDIVIGLIIIAAVAIDRKRTRR